jgi:heat shock protein HtpX
MSTEQPLDHYSDILPEQTHRQTWILIGLAMGLLITCGVGLYGLWGIVLMAILGGVTFGTTLQVSADSIMQMRQARLVTKDKAPDLFRLYEPLVQKAGLSSMPDLYIVPSGTLNAFAVGDGHDNNAVAVTRGLLKTFSEREIKTILAHELGHIKHQDTKLLLLSDVMGRMASILFIVGLMSLFLYLPAMASGTSPISGYAIVLMLLSPTLNSYLQFAVRRTREYEADRAAAELTGDPEGLIMALKRLRDIYGSYWNDSPFAQSRQRTSLKSSHPSLDSRIDRARTLAVRPA